MLDSVDEDLRRYQEMLERLTAPIFELLEEISETEAADEVVTDE